jgi:hypothetical protein
MFLLPLMGTWRNQFVELKSIFVGQPGSVWRWGMPQIGKFNEENDDEPENK